MALNLLRWLPAFRDLDYEQQATVTDCAKPGKLLVYGPAGSGKTAITLFCGKTLHDQGRSFKIVVYTNVLQKFIEAGTAELNLPSDSVTTLYRWARRLFVEQELRLPPYTGNEKFSLWVDGLIAHWQRHPAKIPHYDYILVDEAQDFKPNVAKFLRMMSSNILVAADLAQSLYENIGDRGALEQRWAPLDKIHEVPRNYRNPKVVAELATVFLDPGKADRANFLSRVKGRSGETKPIWYPVASRSKQIDRICDILDQTRGSVRVGLLYRHRDHLDADRQALAQKGVRVQVALNPYKGETTLYNFNDAMPVLTTAHSAKGLEFDWVILPGLDADQWNGDPQEMNERNLFFVALTRAKERLYLLSTQGKECAFLSEILANHRNLIQTPNSRPATRSYMAATPTITPDDDPF